MDTFLHGIHGVIFGYVLSLLGFDPGIIYYIFWFVVGAAPDIAGWLEKVIYHNSDLWNWYDTAHYGIKWLRYVFPPYWLHVWLDSFSHEPGHEWWVWRNQQTGRYGKLWLELTLWLITIPCLLLLI